MRDGSGDELCWHHSALWGLLPETSDLQPTVPSWPEFLRGCVRYRESLDRQLPKAPRSDKPARPEGESAPAGRQRALRASRSDRPAGASVTVESASPPQPEPMRCEIRRYRLLRAPRRGGLGQAERP